MKPIVRKILYILAILALAGVSILLFTSARKVSSSTVSTGEVIVKFTDGESFLSEEQIKEYIESEYGIIAGKIADSINLAKIEDILNSKSMIQNSEVYITKKGDLNVIVSQRKPSVRFQKGSEVIFADKEGKLFSVKSGISYSVPIIDGKIPENDSTWVRRAVALVNWIESSKTWTDKFVQIHAEEDGNIVLVPREGREKFMFGQPDNVASKFARLEDYYKYIVPSKEEGYYGTVSLMYDDHIVCKK